MVRIRNARRFFLLHITISNEKFSYFSKSVVETVLRHRTDRFISTVGCTTADQMAVTMWGQFICKLRKFANFIVTFENLAIRFLFSTPIDIM